MLFKGEVTPAVPEFLPLREEWAKKENPTVMPCITVPSELLETGGTGSAVSDFQ
jgi:hypothetical protein